MGFMLLLFLHTIHVFILIITNRERELARHDGVGVGVGVGVREWRRDFVAPIVAFWILHVHSQLNSK